MNDVAATLTNTPAGVPRARFFTVCTLNTFLCKMFGVNLSARIDERFDLITQELQQARPDIACLQEVWSRRFVRSFRNSMPEYQRITPRRVPITRPLGTGLVLLTPHPVIRSVYRPLLNTRRPKESLASKGVLYAELETGHGVLRVVNVHLGIGHEEPLRAHHEHFLRLLDSYGDVHLICGDFNQAASARSQYYRPGEIHLPFVNDELRRRGFEDALVKQHGSSADEMVTVDSETNPLLESGYHVRLDYIWYRSGAGLLLAPKTAHLWLDRPVEGTFVSDHFGVQSQFEIRPGS